MCVCVCVCVYEQTLDLQLLLMLFCSTLEDAAVVWQVPLPHTPSSPPDRPFFLLSLSISLYLSPQPPSLLSISSPEVLCCSLHRGSLLQPARASAKAGVDKGADGVVVTAVTGIMLQARVHMLQL